MLTEGMEIIADRLDLYEGKAAQQSCQQDEIPNLMNVSAESGNIKAMKKLASAYKHGACGIKADPVAVAYYEDMIQKANSGPRQSVPGT